MLKYREFWQAGYRVFSLHPILKGGRCGCGDTQCKDVGKHPRTRSWQYTPVWSEDQIETMEETDQFATGYGVVCKGLLVIDVDARNGGVESYAKLVEAFPGIAGAGLIVETGSGGGSKHLYYRLPEDLALVTHLPEYPGIDFKSSGYVVGPGSLHKSGNTYRILYGSVDDIEAPPERLLEALKKPDRIRATFEGTTIDVSQDELGDMLSYITNDNLDYDTWVRVGMALHHASGGSAYDLWRAWSSTSSKHDEADMPMKWHSFGKAGNPVTLGTLIHYAQKGGWERPITFVPNEDIGDPLPVGPIEIMDIDLLRPPGFVGEVARWVEQQNRRARETLSVAAAIFAIGNVISLRYTDDLDNVTSNLFVFAVAASGTGKDTVMSSVAEIHRVVKIAAATHGTIKSEQEIVRNLTTHQASYYIIDEIGSLLKKIHNARQKGGAAYLDGVIGILMNIYSKAGKFFLLSGDVKEQTRKSLLQDVAKLEKALDEKPTPGLEAHLKSVQYLLSTIDNGLERPFLSLIGFSTPVDFDSMIDFEAATNGFIGRSLLARETETAPPLKRPFRKVDMPESMKISLQSLFMAGYFDSVGHGRVEFYSDDRTVIPTSPDAVELLEQVSIAFDEMAEEHKSSTGLEALCMRAYELVAKVSFILAAPEGVRTVEHVRWAYAYVKRDIETKVRAVTANDRVKDSPNLALRARLEGIIGTEGENFGTIINRCRNVKRESVEACLNEMVKSGLVSVSENVHKYRKSVTKRYALVKN